MVTWDSNITFIVKEEVWLILHYDWLNSVTFLCVCVYSFGQIKYLSKIRILPLITGLMWYIYCHLFWQTVGDHISVITPLIKISIFFTLRNLHTCQHTRTHTLAAVDCVLFHYLIFGFKRWEQPALSLLFQKEKWVPKRIEVELQLKPIFLGDYDVSLNCNLCHLGHLYLNKGDLKFLRGAVLSYIWTIFSFSEADYS